MRNFLKVTMLLLIIITTFSCSKDDEVITPDPIQVATLSSISPESGKKGISVTINGTNFGSDASKVKVFFNNTEATVQSVTNTQIKTIAPESASTGSVKVTVNGTTVTGPQFTYLVPKLNGISPESGPKETLVTITGNTFGTNQNLVTVFFNDKEAVVQSVSDTEIKVKVPVKAFTGLVKVIVDGTELEGPEFVYLVSEIEVSTIAGSGVIGFADGIGTAAQFRSPQGIVVDDLGNLYVADSDNYILRKITSNGEVSTLAGVGRELGDIDGTGSEARLSGINAIAFTTSGDMLVTDTNNHKIKKITTSGVVTTFAGTGLNGSNNGPALSATFQQNTGVVIDSQGNVYIVERNKHNIRKISASGEVSVFAGDSGGNTTDGNGTDASFTFPYGIAIDADDNLYVTDGGNHLIRKITPNADVTTIAGSTIGFSDGQGAAAQFNSPTGIVVDKQGNIYVSDTSNDVIRMITPDGLVSTFAGSGEGFGDGEASIAQFKFPKGITIDALGDLYVADQGNHRIRKITQE